jgi:hypothetical protein
MRSTGRVIGTTYPLGASSCSNEVNVTMPVELLRGDFHFPGSFTHMVETDRDDGDDFGLEVSVLFTDLSTLIVVGPDYLPIDDGMSFVALTLSLKFGSNRTFLRFGITVDTLIFETSVIDTFHHTGRFELSVQGVSPANPKGFKL